MEYHSGGSLPLLGKPRYCPGANADGGYLCETGHCCGETGCCTYYYELWWFWLLWTALIVFSCCCAYRHRRAKQRVQQQQRQREISLLAYHGASSYPSSMLDLSFLASLKLPSYEEVAAQPSTPPPPYSSVFTTPRYPQPPRAADPHLLTQHGPLLHHPLSDGPSSLSSDNSSSCSCDSCCPSSPCSSSLSAPITYETDTSHASTPSEATPLTLDVTMTTFGTVSIDMRGVEGAGSQEPDTMDSSVPTQTVTLAVVTKAASPQQAPPPDPEPIALAAGAQDPMMQQLVREPGVSTVGSNSSTTPPDPCGPPVPTFPSVSEPPTPTDSASNGATIPAALEDPGSPRTLNPTTAPCSATTEPSTLTVRTLVLVSVPSPGSDLTQTPVEGLMDPLDEPKLRLLNVPDPIDLASTQQPTMVRISDSTTKPPLTLETSPTPAQCEDPAVPPESGLIHSNSSPDPAAVSDYQGRSPSPPSVLNPSVSFDIHTGSGSWSGSGLGSGPSSGLDFWPNPSPVLAVQPPASSPSSCPLITVDFESSLSPHVASAVVSPSVPSSLSSSPSAPTLLLDPLTALNQPDKGGSSSGHASSLSPSPRATQSPPKQTVFSPCVDVFEPGPTRWGEGEDDEEDDVGADESQYRHRRLTGDSGIEVCRCRVEDEEDEEEEHEEKEDEEEEEEKMGNGGGGEKHKNEDVDPDLHDSLDCPARGQVTAAREGVTLCTASATPPRQDGGKVVVILETV